MIGDPVVVILGKGKILSLCLLILQFFIHLANELFPGPKNNGIISVIL